MVNRQKAKGSQAERAVSDYLASRHVPNERIPAGATLDRGDLWVPSPRWPTIDVKNQQALDLAGWVDRAEEQAKNGGRLAGVVWHKRRGKASPADWYVTMSGVSFLLLMREAA